MKILLAALMCLVLCTSECFALKGGPPNPGTTINIIGKYAGVLQGVFDPTNPRSQNTLGLFSLNIPQTGLADGIVVIFVAGRTFVGAMTGVGEPNKTSLRGVIQATSQSTIILCPSNDVIIITGGARSVEVTDRADGSLNATIKTTPQSVSTIAGTLVTGTAVVTATQTVKDPDDCTSAVTIPSSISLQVDGFKQSDT